MALVIGVLFLLILVYGDVVRAADYDGQTICDPASNGATLLNKKRR